MPWKAGGVFERENPDYQGASVWSQDQQASIKIIATRHDFHDEDLAQGIQACLNLNGLNAMLADLDMTLRRLGVSGERPVAHPCDVDGCFQDQGILGIARADNSPGIALFFVTFHLAMTNHR